MYVWVHVRTATNEFPQCMFGIKNKKIRYTCTPSNPSFFYIKVGFKGVYMSQICFPDATFLLSKLKLLNNSARRIIRQTATDATATVTPEIPPHAQKIVGRWLMGCAGMCAGAILLGGVTRFVSKFFKSCLLYRFALGPIAYICSVKLKNCVTFI